MRRWPAPRAWTGCNIRSARSPIARCTAVCGRSPTGSPTPTPPIPLSLPLAELLLRGALHAAAVDGEKLAADSGGLHRLRPAIDRLRHDPADAPGAEQAAALCALSPAYFSRRFKQQVGMSWSDYVRTHRLHLASRRLLESDQSIAAIAYSLGFSTPSHFGELFHRRFGMTPMDYRRRARLHRTSMRPDGNSGRTAKLNKSK